MTDAVGLTTSAEYDYRVLQPRMVTDANGNRRAVTFSPLGLVTATAVMGKEGEPVGDTLEAPGSRLEYDFFAFANRQRSRSSSAASSASTTSRRPTCRCRSGTRRSRPSSIPMASGGCCKPERRPRMSCSAIRTSAEASCPPDQSIATGDAVGRRRAAGDPPNVIVSGWQVYDNKGRVVEKYEPFFSAGCDYAPPSDAQFGQKATMFYDPRGQVIRTLNPDGSEQRVIYGIPADLTNPDAVRTHALGSLHLRRERSGAAESRGRMAHRSPTAAPATHHFTPSSIVIDALGRTVEAIARNRDARNPADPALSRTHSHLRHSRQCAHGDGRAGPRRLSLYLRPRQPSLAHRQHRCRPAPHGAERAGQRNRAARQQRGAHPPGLRSPAATDPPLGTR